MKKDMKITKVSKTDTSGVPSYVKISHTQGMRQSHNYQTADVSYSVELFVKDTPTDIAAGILRCEEIVENALGDKLPQSQALLHAVARKNK